MPKGPNNRPTLKQALREIWDASNTAFVGTMRGLSGNIVCGAVLVLSLFLFSSLGLELVLVGARDAHLARSPSGLCALEAGRLV